MYECFDRGLRSEELDRNAFTFGHTLIGHEALTLEHLARVLPTLPPQQVMYSMGMLNNGDDFEGTFRRRPKNITLDQTIESIRTSDSYIMVRSPELHASFAPLHRKLIADVEAVMKARGVGSRPIDPQLYLFIASPSSVTPFHIDRYSTFLLQFRGSKEVCVFPQWDERVVSAPDREAYVARRSTKLPWRNEVDFLGRKFVFRPGEALHIPFIAGHYVRNGPDDISISMSIIFNTVESLRWRRALAFNHASRKYLARIGMRPSAVGVAAWRDGAKSSLWRAHLRSRGF